ncbi:hypothetical protein J7I93_18790 [Bacillus sp. ISL-47]|uniref:hypothetical protein n=1 Tax=Bacillus sp. ISL-47 TaxID=2819130 RepID=UPI001BE7BD31|nr:hypothetical protein [Bacillus sp. ISL-47]MBT2690221.1 hypothetical protein [Bacillus sp. ISL-47]MBT2709014.1 hypothetical protein [Pseudomonas sp. ISL-84]
MKQIVELHERTRDKIAYIEKECEKLAKKLHNKYKQDFQIVNEHLVIDLVRSIKGRNVNNKDVFTVDYESFLEVGIETEEDYFPNAYIPIWKCKQEMFQSVGYLTDLNMDLIEKKMEVMIEEMLSEREEGEKHE